MEIEFNGIILDGCSLFAKENPLPDAMPELANLEGWTRWGNGDTECGICLANKEREWRK